jgi:hypothetical protein
MSLRGLRQQLADIKARMPSLGKLRPVLISWWSAAVAGGKPIRLPDWPPHDKLQAPSPPVSGSRKRVQRPVGPRQLTSICMIFVDAETASVDGHAVVIDPAERLT